MTAGLIGKCRRVALLGLALADCVSSSQDARPLRENTPPPSPGLINGVGYDDAVAMGAEYTRSLGYQSELAEAHWTGRDWLLRYRLRSKQELKELQMHVDAVTRQIHDAEERALAGLDAGVGGP